MTDLHKAAQAVVDAFNANSANKLGEKCLALEKALAAPEWQPMETAPGELGSEYLLLSEFKVVEQGGYLMCESKRLGWQELPGGE